MASSNAPVSIQSITLVVNGLNKMIDFYRDVIGLNEISRDASSAQLGQGNNVLLHLLEDRDARVYPREAGLFHTAFVLPDRADLGSWLSHAKSTGVKLDGAADHIVSEAIYLNDPEGNGIEVYVDRDRSNWSVKDNGEILLGSTRLDLEDLEASATNDWKGLPDDSVIGHVHLKVGDIAKADDFYRDQLGMTKTMSDKHVSFYSSGGYHHHFAGNIWNSRGASLRPVDATGFYEVELKVENDNRDMNDLVDPWGMKIRFSETEVQETGV